LPLLSNTQHMMAVIREVRCAAPFYEEHGIPLCRVLTARGTESCGLAEHHEYELYLAVENIDHTRTKARRCRGRRSWIPLPVAKEKPLVASDVEDSDVHSDTETAERRDRQAESQLYS
jgi:hypothetical protein